MPTYVIRAGELIEKHLAPPRYESSAAPNVISDIMEPTKHMVTGTMHTSKSAFRADTKASGCAEVGNDSSLYKARKPVQLSREKRVEDIKRTIYNMRNGRSY
jgi:hypothetical protein